jgi:hypothetical protein
MAETTPVQDGRRGPRRTGDSASWIVGVALIALGVAFLLERAGFFAFSGNWWAVFIYLAALATFANAWRAYRARGEFGPQATGSLVWGLVLTVVASIFMFDLAWDAWWPALLIAAGVGIVVGQLLGSATRRPDDPAAG